MSSRPATLVIFGVSGDLARRKLLPALYWLIAAGKLPELNIIGVARRELTPEGIISSFEPWDSAPDPEIIANLRGRLSIVRMDSADPAEYERLRTRLEELEDGALDPVRLMHLAIPPTVSGPVIEALQASGLMRSPNARMLIEKPFGFDLESAQELEDKLNAACENSQVYRIDHYLARAGVRQLTTERFENPILMARWNSKHISKIEVKATETIGVEGRADFYEQTGALRDIVQSHLMNLTSLALMQPPTEQGAEGFRQSRLNALNDVLPIEPDEVADRSRRGQYEGYRDEVGNDDSFTETFAALNLRARSWGETALVQQAGKALNKRSTEITVWFKNVAEPMKFNLAPAESGDLDRLPDGYEHVFLEALKGDQTFFVSGEEVIRSWEILRNVLRAWSQSDDGLVFYPRGSEGPSLWE